MPSFKVERFTVSLVCDNDLLKTFCPKILYISTASNADVLANPENYYINNFFSAAHYTGFGHVKGAVRVNPLSIDECDKLDPNGKVVTYCYTGQTSAVITAYLNVLGFDAYSLTFGINGMATSSPFWTAGDGVTNHWGFDSNPKDLSTVTE